MSLRDTQVNLFAHDRVNLQMISVYKTKQKTAIKSRKKLEFINNHLHITPSKAIHGGKATVY